MPLILKPMSDELIYQLALSEVSQIGCVQAKILIQHFGEATSIFKAKESQLKKIEGIGEIRARNIKSFHDFKKEEEEIEFIEKYKIKPLFITDKNYPQRLLNCYDSPTLLFYKGNADLNSQKIISIVGTRSNTAYAKQVVEKLLSEIACQNILIISGMALGVDSLAHKNALKNNLATVGIVAHGLDQIYPAEHSILAKEMLKNNGGLLTEFRSKVKPDKHNFPIRNRIVAGISDATIVIETDIKGGSMITAELANGYNRDVFAVPGKLTDKKSTGCNYLIRNNKAILFSSTQEFVAVMGWEETKKNKSKMQKELFVELNKDEKIIVTILKEKEFVSIDEINLKSNLSSSTVAAAILQLEFSGLVYSLPGKIYTLA